MPEEGHATIGPYRLLRLIGEGGMGEVYLARREQDFHQQVALKLVRRGAANPETIRRFLIERQTLAGLQHPNIVGLIDGGATDEGVPYLVVDYVDGVPIDRYCEERQLSTAARLRLFAEVCDAVAYAHRALVVHCDLKPGNILVTAEGRPMLLDFGIAKLLDPLSAGISEETARTRQRAFTLEYASPEQVAGQPVTTATDVYALGVVVYELLAGRSPYRGTPDSLAGWVRAVCQEEAAPPSAHRPVDGDVDAMVLKALRKRPEDRYESVAALAADVRRYLNGDPVRARRHTTGYVTRKFIAKHKMGMATALVTVLALVGGLAATLWQARIAARRFEDVRRLAHVFLFDVHDAIQYLPGSTEARGLIARTGTEYLDGLERESHDDRGLERELAQGYLKIGDVEGNPYGANLGDSAKSIASYRKALEIAEALEKRDPQDAAARRLAAKSHLDLAFVLPAAGKLKDAVQQASQALAIDQALAAERPGDAEAKLDLAAAYERQGDLLGGPADVNLGRLPDAVAAYRRGMAEIPDVPPGDALAARAGRAKASLEGKLGMAQDAAGDRRGGLARYGEAIAIAEDLARRDPSNQHARDLVISLLNQVAYDEQALGNTAGALESYRKASAMSEGDLGRDPHNSQARDIQVSLLRNLGSLYLYQLNRAADAAECYRRAVELLEAAGRDDRHNVTARKDLSVALAFWGSALIASGHAAQGRTESARALELGKQLADAAGATHDAVYNYAWLLVTADPADLQNPRAALPYALKAAHMSPGVEEWSVVGQAYAGVGDYGKAMEAVEEGLKKFPGEAGLMQDRDAYRKKAGR